MLKLILKLLASIFIFALVSCDSSDAFFVNAGVDQTVQIGTEVTLVGAAGSPDGTITSYQWSQISGVAVELTGDNTSTANFTAPMLTTDATLTFRLVVDDDRGARVTDDVNVFVTVQPFVGFSANAGEDQTVQAREVVILEGDGINPNGVIISYEWIQISGDKVVLTGADTNTASFIAPDVIDDIVLTFQLIAIDSSGAEVTDDVDVTVQELIPPPPSQATTFESEPNDDLSVADVLALNETISGQLRNDGTDEDWFEVDFVVGTNYQVLFSGNPVTFVQSVWTLAIYDSSNNLLKSTILLGTGAVSSTKMDVAVTASGKYYVVVNSTSSSVPSADYAVTVTAK